MPKLSKNAIREHHDQTFVDALAATNSPQKAMIVAEPQLADRPQYAAVKANRMLKRSDIQAKIQIKLEKMQPKALKTIDKLINSDNETIATANAWRVVEHLRGTPVKRTISAHTKANIEDALFD